MDYTYYNNTLDSTAQYGILAGLGTGTIIVCLIISIISIVSMWKIFEKAGRPGWASIIPLYNVWVLFEIGGQQGWKVLLCLIPLAGAIIFFIYTILVYLEIAKRFGKSSVFGVLMIFFAPIMFPILAFSDAKYNDATTPTV